MREVDEEIREIKKEIIESRGLTIKTNNLTNALSADIKAIAKRQAAHERRTWWNSVAAYALLAAACLFGFRLLLDVSVREMEVEKEHLEKEVSRLRTAVDEDAKRAEARSKAQAKAAQFVELSRSKRRAELISLWESLDKDLLSPAERTMFRDVVERFQSELSVEAYQTGLEQLRTGRYAEASESFQEALSLGGVLNVAEVQQNLAQAYVKLGKFGQAKLEAERVLAQSNDKEVHPRAALTLAQALDGLGDLDGARAQLRKIPSKWPRSSVLPDARQYLGVLNLKALRTSEDR